MVIERDDGVLSKLRGGLWPVLDEASEQARRTRIAARVLEVQRELTARRARRRRFGAAFGAAALVAAAAGALLFVHAQTSAPPAVAPAEDAVLLVAGHASLRDAAGLAPLARGRLSLEREAVLVTAHDGAELRLSSNTELSVAPSTEVALTRRRRTPELVEERVRLRAGGVALRVPKLGARGKVSVETRDALVEVHGTQFSVRVVERPPLEVFTEVNVREGRVRVSSGNHERVLVAGESWSSREVTPEPPAVAAPAAPPTSRAPSKRAAQSRVAPSDLAAQNRLLEAAELAQKSGMPRLALERLEALIARYPDAELAHNARVERLRVLRLAGRDVEARAAARDYLERHPDGFARTEAEQLLEGQSD